MILVVLVNLLVKRVLFFRKDFIPQSKALIANPWTIVSVEYVPFNFLLLKS
jgi:hypothetical protein